MKQSEIQGINSIMFRIKLLAVLLLLSLQLAGQESRYRPVGEYRKLDWIDETAVELPEYEISDWRVEDLFNKFIHSEKSQGYYDPEGYILVKVRTNPEELTETVRLMSIYPNLLSYSFYGKYDGVLEYGGHIFILSGLSGKESRLFALTGKCRRVEFIKRIEDKPGIWFYWEDGVLYAHDWRLPDPIEDGYPKWQAIFPESGRYMFTEKYSCPPVRCSIGINDFTEGLMELYISQDGFKQRYDTVVVRCEEDSLHYFLHIFGTDRLKRGNGYCEGTELAFYGVHIPFVCTGFPDEVTRAYSFPAKGDGELWTVAFHKDGTLCPAFTVKADGKECIEDIVDLAERNLNGSRNTCLSLASVFIPANGML